LGILEHIHPIWLKLEQLNSSLGKNRKHHSLYHTVLIWQYYAMFNFPPIPTNTTFS